MSFFIYDANTREEIASNIASVEEALAFEKQYLEKNGGKTFLTKYRLR